MFSRSDFCCHAPMCTTAVVAVGMALQGVVILQETPH
jgi:hypothetical protein